MPPRPDPRRFPRARLVAAAVAFAAFVWGGFSALRASEYDGAPTGDAAYYTEMACSFFSPARLKAPISTIHSRRVLVPFIAALALKLAGIDAQGECSFTGGGSSAPWSAGQSRALQGIETAWKSLNAVCYLALAAFLALLMPEFLGAGLALALTASLLLIPCLGLLYVYWPEMNDPLSLALAAGGCVLLARGRELPGFAVLGLSALAREQIVFLIPVFFLIRPPRRPVACLLASCAPYAAILAFPVFPNQRPFPDALAGTVLTTPSAAAAYAALLRHHLRHLAAYTGTSWPAAVAVNLGPLLIVRAASGLPRTRLFWPTAALGLVFTADRHMALLNLPLLLMLSLSSPETFVRREKLRLALGAWLAAAVLFLLRTRTAMALQLWHWDMVLPPELYKRTVPCVSALVVAAFLWALGAGATERVSRP